MAKLTNLQQNQLVKMLMMGDSGNGKTGCLASLAIAGYELFILDFDKGLDPLVQVLKDNPEALARVHYQDCTDKLKMVGQFIQLDGPSRAFPNAMRHLTEWKEQDDSGKEVTFGKTAQLGDNAIIVVDSSTMLGEAIMRHVKFTNSSQDKPRSQPEWGAAQDALEKVFVMLVSGEFNCHVIVMSHIKYIGGEQDEGKPDNPNDKLKGLPSVLGKALPPKIGAYFNTALMVEKQVIGKKVKRFIKRSADAIITTKDPLINSTLPDELPIETGLAQYFEAFLGKKPSGVLAKTTPTAPAATTTITQQTKV